MTKQKVDESSLVERIIVSALRDIGPVGMTGPNIDAIAKWVRRAEITRGTLELAEQGAVVAFVRDDGAVAFREAGLPGVGGRSAAKTVLTPEAGS